MTSFTWFDMVPPSPVTTRDAWVDSTFDHCTAGGFRQTSLPSPRQVLDQVYVPFPPSSFSTCPPPSPPLPDNNDIGPQGTCAGVRLTAIRDLKVRTEEREEREKCCVGAAVPALGDLYVRSLTSHPL